MNSLPADVLALIGKVASKKENPPQDAFTIQQFLDDMARDDPAATYARAKWKLADLERRGVIKKVGVFYTENRKNAIYYRKV